MITDEYYVDEGSEFESLTKATDINGRKGNMETTELLRESRSHWKNDGNRTTDGRGRRTLVRVPARKDGKTGWDV